MPTYEYRCPAGHQFDRFMKMSESVAELPCPECGEAAARQLSGGAGLVFKGSGFYLTDYGRNAHRTSGPATPPASGSGEGKPRSDAPESGTKSDAKPSGGDAAKGSAGPAGPAAGSGGSTRGSSGSGGSGGSGSGGSGSGGSGSGGSGSGGSGSGGGK